MSDPSSSSTMASFCRFESGIISPTLKDWPNGSASSTGAVLSEREDGSAAAVDGADSATAGEQVLAGTEEGTLLARIFSSMGVRPSGLALAAFRRR